jgi:phage terminase large subunit-like protein
LTNARDAERPPNIADIARLARRIDGQGLLQAVALDPYGVGAIVDGLDEAGISGENRTLRISQGWKLTGAIKTAERKLAEDRCGTADRGYCPGQWAMRVSSQREMRS